MRITNSILYTEGLSAIQRNLSAMNDAQNRVSSGLRVATASDDPVAAASIMQTGSGLRALDQYKRNISAASLRLNTEEQTLDQLTDLLSRGMEIGTSQGTATATAETRQTFKTEVDQIIQQVIGSANQQLDGGYLFGGDFSNTAPFTDSGAYTNPSLPPQGSLSVEVSTGQTLATNHDGKQVFVDTDVIGSLQALSAALGANDVPGIQTALNRMNQSHSKVQSLLGEVGARSNRLDIASSNIDALAVGLKTAKSDLSDVEMEDAVTTLVNRQTAYQAALMATSRIMQTTLADYLQ